MLKQVFAEQAKALMDQEDILIIDIRDPGSYEESRIKNAVHVNDQNIEEFVQGLDKSKKLLCYCYHGHSSQMAAQYFIEQGVEQVYSLIGGFEEWRVSFPVENGD